MDVNNYLCCRKIYMKLFNSPFIPLNIFTTKSRGTEKIQLPALLLYFMREAPYLILITVF